MYKKNESLVSKIKRYSAPIFLTTAFVLTQPIYANEVKAQQTTEQTEQKKDKSMVQDIVECVGAIKDYWVAFQEQESKQCLINYTNPDTWNHVGATVQAVECGVRAVVDHTRHITPSESEREALENLTAVYDNFLKIRELIEHPDPNAELIYTAIDDHIAELDRRSQELARVGDKECGEMWSAVYNKSKKLLGLASSEEIKQEPKPAQDANSNIEVVVQGSRTSEESFSKSSVHEGVTSDQYVRTNDLYNKNRVERGLKPVESLSKSNLAEVEVYNTFLQQIKDSDTVQEKKPEVIPEQNYKSPDIDIDIKIPKAPKSPPTDGAGRTPAENAEIDKSFYDRHPELNGRPLDGKNAQDRELRKDWHKDAKAHDKKKGK